MLERIGKLNTGEKSFKQGWECLITDLERLQIVYKGKTHHVRSTKMAITVEAIFYAGESSQHTDLKRQQRGSPKDNVENAQQRLELLCDAKLHHVGCEKWRLCHKQLQSQPAHYQHVFLRCENTSFLIINMRFCDVKTRLSSLSTCVFAM